MIYSYSKIITVGADGTTLQLKNTEDNSITELGSIDGVTYIHVPDNVSLPEQHSELTFTKVELTTEQKTLLKSQVVGKFKKSEVRAKINTISDIEDLIADCMKLIEFNLMMTARLFGDYTGSVPLDEATKSEYNARNTQFLTAVASGQILLRGEFDNVNTMMTELFAKYSTIQKVVRDNYIDELAKLGLK